MSTTTELARPAERSARFAGLIFGAVGAIAFSGKAIIVKLSYRYGVDAVTVIMYRMLFAWLARTPRHSGPAGDRQAG